MSTMLSYNDRMTRTHPVWGSNTNSTSVAPGATVVFKANPAAGAGEDSLRGNYIVVANNNSAFVPGAILTVAPVVNGVTQPGIELQYGQPLKFAVDADAQISVNNATVTAATVLWLT